jgi:TatD DNase family protein
MQFVDTHCHVHFPDYELDADQVIRDAAESGVTRLIAVGCTLHDSKRGIDLAARYQHVWASIGVHPHESSDYVHDHHALQQLHGLASAPKVVAVGEIGLDYHYMHSSKEDQQKMFRYQLDIAVEHNLPVIFHVREAFDDFFKILDEHADLTGVVHSFTATKTELDGVIKRGLHIGLNGIMTFTKDTAQLEAAKSVPLNRLVLETDAPFLTPVPYRGKICQPKYVVETARFLSDLRGESLEELAMATTRNAKELFNLA